MTDSPPTSASLPPSLESVGTWLWHPRSGQLELAPNIAWRLSAAGTGCGNTLTEFLACLIPADGDRVEAELHRALRSRLEFSIEFQVHWPDGIIRAFEMRGAATAEGKVAGMIWDSTESQRLHEELTRRVGDMDRYLFAFRAARVSAWTYLPLTGHYAVDGLGEDLLGMVPGSFTGTISAFVAAIHSEDRSRIDTELRAALETSDRFVLVFRPQTADLGPRWLRSIGQVFRNSTGAAVRVAGTTQDVTTEIETKRALESYAKQLELARQAAEEASLAKAQFLANMSHTVGTERNGHPNDPRRSPVPAKNGLRRGSVGLPQVPNRLLLPGLGADVVPAPRWLKPRRFPRPLATRE